MDSTVQDGLNGSAQPSERLYSRAAVLWATILGSPFAGGILMALNWSRLGERDQSKSALRWTGMFTAAILSVAYLLPDSVNLPLPISTAVQMGLMGWYYSVKQQQILEAHLSRGGKKASIFGATGVGFCCLVGVLVLLLGVDEIAWLKHGLPYGKPYFDQVFYKDGATREDAAATAEILRDMSWFTGFPGREVQIRREGPALHVALLVVEGALRNEESLAYFHELGAAFLEGDLADTVQLDLCLEPFEVARALEYPHEGDSEPVPAGVQDRE